MNNIELKEREDKRKKKNNVKRKEVIANINNLKLTKWNTKRDCDVIITSSSRLELLKLTLEYFKNNIHFHGNFRFILNEDYVLPEKSKKLVKWAENSGYFEKKNIYCNNPPLGLVNGIISLINKVKTPFLIYLQDDWAFERPIELDKAIYMMEKIPQINNILFYKYKVPYAINGIHFREYYFRQFPQHLTLYNAWEFIPGIWRRDFIKPIIKEAMKRKEQRTAPAKLTHYLRNPSKRGDYDFLFNNMGVFMWGAHGEPRWVRHIGENERMESWRMSENGVPGTENTCQENNIINMAEWIPFEHIPKIKGRNSVRLIKEKLIRGGRIIQ